MKRAVPCFVVLIFLALAANAQDAPPGFDAASFLEIGIDARPLAMGGTGVAMAAGNPIPYYNPALLVRAPELGVGGMYSEPYGQELGISFQSMHAVGRVGSQTGSATASGFGLGVTWLQLRIEDIVIWDEENPGDAEVFAATSSVYLVSASTSLLPELAIGLSGKVYRENVLQGRGRGLGIDIGLLATLNLDGLPVWVGLNSMDFLQTVIRWRDTQGEPDNFVPWVNKIGFAAEIFDGMGLVSADFDWAVGRHRRDQKIHLGLEAKPVDGLFLRAGWAGDLEGLDSRLSVGLGIDFFDSFRLDYAYVPPRTIYGTGHFLSLQLSFPFSAEWLGLSRP